MSEHEMQTNIENTADLIKKLFSDLKAKQLDKPYRPAKRFRERATWLAAAELCNAAHADPFDYVTAAFIFCCVPGGPFPHMLANSAGPKWYAQYARQHIQKGDGAFSTIAELSVRHTTKEIMEQAMTSGKRLETFLLDEYTLPEHSTPAYMRMLLLPKSRPLLAKYGRKARAEVCGNQQLLGVLQKMGWDLSWLE